MAAAPVLSEEMGGDETDDTAGPVARSRPESPKGGSQCPAHANGLRISITCCSCAAATMESQAPVGTECPRTRKSPGSSTAEVAEVQPLQLEPKAKPKAKTRPQPKVPAHGPQRVSVGHPLYPSEIFMRQHWLEGPWRADRDEQQKNEQDRTGVLTQFAGPQRNQRIQTTIQMLCLRNDLEWPLPR